MELKRPLNLSSRQASLISLLLVGAVMAVVLVLSIGYRTTSTGALALAGIAALGLGAAIFMRPQLGTYVLVVSIFTNASSVFTDQGLPGINKALIAIVFLGVLVNRLSRHKSLPPLKRVEWFMLAYGGIWLASFFVAQAQDIVFDQVVDFIKDFVFILCLIYATAAKPSYWKRMIWLIILAAALLAAIGTYQILTGNTEQTFFGFSQFVQAQIVKRSDAGRLSGPLGDPNFYGQIMVAVLPLALYRLLDESKLIHKFVAGSTAFLLVFIILNTYSRGAFLAMIVVLLLIALERKVNFSLILLVILATTLLMQFLPAGFTDRLQTLTVFANEEANVSSEISFQGRSSEMLAAINMFLDHPFLGVGVGNYVVHYQDYASELGLEYRTEARQAHSLYLEIAAETGLFGLITFFSLIAVVLLGLHQARQKLKIMSNYRHWSTWIVSLQMSLIAYLTSSIFLHGDFIRYLWLFVAIAATMIHLADKLYKKMSQQWAGTTVSYDN